MDFSETDWNKLLPPYLTEPDKARLKIALMQFKKENYNGTIAYNDFYAKYGVPYFIQADIIEQVRISSWNSTADKYDKKFVNAIILSNSCDISFDNTRTLNNKQCLFAPIVLLNSYLAKLRSNGYEEDKLRQHTSEIKGQLVTNLFYLPSGIGGPNDYIALLDQVFWFPVSEIENWISEIDKRRPTSLNQFGFYLFILKLSYHLCRLPEEQDRLYKAPTT